MPWQRSFDEDEVLGAAMDIFWQRGFRNVSMSDLVEQLGVSRSSLYATYGQKDDLFIAALRRYDRIHRAEWFDSLGEQHPPLQSIRRAFEEVVASSEGSQRFGCLLVNTTLDLPQASAELNDLVQQAFDATQQFFESQLDAACESGEMTASVDTHALAATLLALFLGLRVLGRAQRPTEAVTPILDQVAALLTAV